MELLEKMRKEDLESAKNSRKEYIKKQKEIITKDINDNRDNYKLLRRNYLNFANDLEEKKRELFLKQYEIKKIPEAKFIGDVEFDFYKDEEYVKIMKEMAVKRLEKEVKTIEVEVEILTQQMGILEKHLNKFKVEDKK